jgi:hypothetical protein
MEFINYKQISCREQKFTQSDHRFHCQSKLWSYVALADNVSWLHAVRNCKCDYEWPNVSPQFGFRKGMSIENAAFKLTDSILKSITQKCMLAEYSVNWQKLLRV